MNDLINPGITIQDVIPDDDTDIADFFHSGRILRPRALVIGTAGALRVGTLGGEDVILPLVPVGVLPVQVSRVFATGTDADNIAAIF